MKFSYAYGTLRADELRVAPTLASNKLPLFGQSLEVVATVQCSERCDMLPPFIFLWAVWRPL